MKIIAVPEYLGMHLLKVGTIGKMTKPSNSIEGKEFTLLGTASIQNLEKCSNAPKIWK